MMTEYSSHNVYQCKVRVTILHIRLGRKSQRVLEFMARAHDSECER